MICKDCGKEFPEYRAPSGRRRPRCRDCSRAFKNEWWRRRGRMGSRKRNKLHLTVPVDDVAEMIWTMLDEDGISINELARRTGLNEATLRRIINGQRERVYVEPTLDRLCAYGDKLLYDFFDPR